MHVTKNIDTNTKDYYTLHLHKHYFEKIKTNIYFNDNIITNKNLYKNFLSLCEVLNTKKLTNHQLLIDSFFNEFVLNYSSKIDEEYTNNFILQEIKKFILENIKEQITLDDIANNIGYNKEYIVRIFKNEFGLTPHAFLMNEKINYAKKLLDNNNKSICDIAVDIGFYDQSHFTKLFKKSFATTPKRYKISK